MGAPEKKIIDKRLSSLGPDERLFRINAGLAWVGQIIQHSGSQLILKNPRPFHGAPPGWPDLAGLKSITITPEMVGQKIAVFVGEEVKATGNLSKVQKKFRDMVIGLGGVFRVLRKEKNDSDF